MLFLPHQLTDMINKGTCDAVVKALYAVNSSSNKRTFELGANCKSSYEVALHDLDQK